MNSEQPFQFILEERGDEYKPKFTAYNLFCREKLKGLVGNKRNNRMRNINFMWNNLSELEKKQWHQLADFINN